MSYSRWGWDGSDVYIYGTTSSETIEPGAEGNSITCCGCWLNDDDDGFGPGADLTTYGDLLRHISAHRAAGHHVPGYVDERIRAEIADPAEQWIPVGDLPDTMHPDPGIVRPEPETLRRTRECMEAYRAADTDKTDDDHGRR